LEDAGEMMLSDSGWKKADFTNELLKFFLTE